jgi:hypothetical protein
MWKSMPLANTNLLEKKAIYVNVDNLGVCMYDPSLQVANQFLYICKNQM